MGRLQLAINGHVFDAHAVGRPRAEPVLLLHGWPQTAAAWREVMPLLAESGCRAVAPNLRGYSPGARPRAVSQYRMSHLVQDALAMIDSIGRGSAVHVVGHDWGGAVAWSLAGRHPDRLASLTVLSTPHPRAMSKALTTSDQLLRSWYVGAFQVPMVPEVMLTAEGGALLRWALERSGLPTDYATEYATALGDPTSMRAAINWYRAAARSPASARGVSPIRVPTSYVWSDGDVALSRVAAEATASHVAGPYRFEILHGASHWLPETRPEAVTSVVLDRLRQTR